MTRVPPDTQSFDTSLLDVLACPFPEHAPLHYDEAANELRCASCHKAFPIHDGIPVLLKQEARPL